MEDDPGNCDWLVEEDPGIYELLVEDDPGNFDWLVEEDPGMCCLQLQRLDVS